MQTKQPDVDEGNAVTSGDILTNKDQVVPIAVACVFKFLSLKKLKSIL